MKRFLLLLLLLVLSVVVTIILLIGAGMAGGACHCMTPMFTLFPFGSFIWDRWDNFGFLLVLLQFPVYVAIVTMVKGPRWKIASVLLIVALHVLASVFGYRAYCQSRSTCALATHRRNLWM